MDSFGRTESAVVTRARTTDESAPIALTRYARTRSRCYFNLPSRSRLCVRSEIIAFSVTYVETRKRPSTISLGSQFDPNERRKRHATSRCHTQETERERRNGDMFMRRQTEKAKKKRERERGGEGKRGDFGARLRTRFSGQRTLVGSAREPSSFFPGEISLSVVARCRSARYSTKSGCEDRRERERGIKEGRKEGKKEGGRVTNETQRLMGKAGEKSSAETVGRDKRVKKWVNLCFAFAFSRGVGHRFAATWRRSLFPSPPRRSRGRRRRRHSVHREAQPGRGAVCHFARCSLRRVFESCLSERTRAFWLSRSH